MPPACGFIPPGQHRADAYADHERHGEQTGERKRKPQLNNAKIVDAQQGKGRQTVKKGFPGQRQKKLRILVAALQRVQQGVHGAKQRKGRVRPCLDNTFADAEGRSHTNNGDQYGEPPHGKPAEAVLALRNPAARS